jgi:lipoprotein-releasing system ATP-binding protein
MSDDCPHTLQEAPEHDVPLQQQTPLQRGKLAAGSAVGIDLGAPGGPQIAVAASGGKEATASGALPRARHAIGATPEYQLAAVNLRKSYRKGGATIPVLTGLNLGVRRGEFLAVVGQSGSGKSTLLHLLGTLDAPDDGQIYFHGERIDGLPRKFRDKLRNKHLGMIFQMYHLLPELTTLENVLAPLMIGQGVFAFLRHRREHRATAARLLDLVGLGHRLKHKPRELSGGEMQRAAIARALVAGPQVLLADEPTGNLDRETGNEILRLLGSLNRQENLTIVMVTHDPVIAQRADRMVRLVDGRIEAL